MKNIVKIALAVFVISLIACTDKKKEEAEVKAAVETIDSLELEVDELSKEVDTKTKELEESLEALDSI